MVSFNPLCANFVRGSIDMYLHFMSFLQTDLTQEVEILPDVQGAMVSATVLFTKLKRIYSVHAR